MLRQELAEVESYYGDILQRSVRRVEGLLQENETLKAEHSKLLESSSHIKASREKEIAEVRSQLETEKTRGEELWEELSDTEQALAEVRSENSELKKNLRELALAT